MSRLDPRQEYIRRVLQVFSAWAFWLGASSDAKQFPHPNTDTVAHAPEPSVASCMAYLEHYAGELYTHLEYYTRELYTRQADDRFLRHPEVRPTLTLNTLGRKLRPGPY
jgi:hypothetical protein